MSISKIKTKPAQNQDENPFGEALHNYLSDLFFISLAILIYRIVPFYKTFLFKETQFGIMILWITFMILGLPYYLYLAEGGVCKSRKVLIGLKEYFPNLFEYFRKRWTGRRYKKAVFDPSAKVAILFMLVKFFYLPLMYNFVLSHIFDMKRLYVAIATNHTSWSLLIDQNYIFLMNLLFFIDTLYFAFGYTVESKSLNNEVRSVEPTLIGWAVALVCYPPFNDLFGQFFPWGKTDPILFQKDPLLTLICRIVILILVIIYVWATVALGTRCSNLTNRGIVDKGPYAFIRHPAYISKNMTWWIMTIPVLSWQNLLGAFAWSFIYFLRAITEERHLMADPEYRAYCKKVKWKFIPYIY
jgi:protein-S-isoprenylcysteine O-methyltransferase Ste14